MDFERAARRIRQYEDFFNASGMATPDDQHQQAAALLTSPRSIGLTHAVV